MSTRKELGEIADDVEDDQLIPDNHITPISKPYYFDLLGNKSCCMTLLGVMLPPLFVYIRKERCCSEVIICIFLSILGGLPGTLYAFH